MLVERRLGTPARGCEAACLRRRCCGADGLKSGDVWAVAANRLLEIVNDLLTRAGSPERLYGVYGGNDGRVLLLTEQMYRLLQAPDLKIDPGWMPYPPDAIRRDGSRLR